MDSRISVFDLILRLAGRLAGQLGKPKPTASQKLGPWAEQRHLMAL